MWSREHYAQGKLLQTHPNYNTYYWGNALVLSSSANSLREWHDRAPLMNSPSEHNSTKVRGPRPRRLLTREDWREVVTEIPVFDTHSHLNNPGVPIVARDIWDIVHYFWFLQELESVGYPKSAGSLPEEERVEQFVKAFALTKNTTWASIVTETVHTLYGVELRDARSLRLADEAVKDRAQDAGRAREVLNLLQIQKVTVNGEAAADYPDLPGVGVAVPLPNDFFGRRDRVLTAKDPVESAEEVGRLLREEVAAIAARGWRGLRVPIRGFESRCDGEAFGAVTRGGGLEELRSNCLDERAVEAFLAHAILAALEEHGMFAQLFLGIHLLRGCKVHMAVDDPRWITNLYPLFERYSCGFELVAGSPGSNMDVAQAARIYPNVHAGGLWWYNFRRSTYREAMQFRLEAVPASKSVILASDARCVEWCYAKTLLVKRLVADFLCEQVRGGWLNEADALWVAHEWLHDAAARRYV